MATLVVWVLRLVNVEVRCVCRGFGYRLEVRTKNRDDWHTLDARHPTAAAALTHVPALPLVQRELAHHQEP